jgi:hypothetical protein
VVPAGGAEGFQALDFGLNVVGLKVHSDEPSQAASGTRMARTGQTRRRREGR